MESDSQAGVAIHEGLDGSSHAGGFKLSINFQSDLHGIDVGSVVIVQRVEAQALLQGGEGKNIFEARRGFLQPFKLGLSEVHQGEVERSMPTSGKVLDLFRENLDTVLPCRSQFFCIGLGHTSRSP